MSETVPARASGGVVAVPVHCRRCGYNLYGLRADGACPECGLAAWESILHTVDPAASRLPRLRNPEAVGDSLVWLMSCAGLSAVILVLRPVVLWIDSLDPRGLSDLAAWAPVQLRLLAGIAALAAVRAVFWLAPPIGAEGALRREIWLLGCGLAGWGVSIIAVTWLDLSGAAAASIGAARLAGSAAAIAGLLGLGGVLAVVGTRSREYRTARGGRQGALAMVAAIIGTAAGQSIQVLARVNGWPGGVATSGTVIAAIGTLMLLIGLAYLLVNVWWIRRSLRRPPPGWDEVIKK